MPFSPYQMPQSIIDPIALIEEIKEQKTSLPDSSKILEDIIPKLLMPSEEDIHKMN